MPIKTHKVRLYPNQTMQAVLTGLTDYNRYCWNHALTIWNDQYTNAVWFDDKTLRPNERRVRDELVKNKADWQYRLSARVLQQSVHRLGQAWKNFFNPKMPNARKPKYHSKRAPKQSFTTDRAHVKDGWLILDQPREADTPYWQIKMAEPLRFTGEIKTVTITKRGNKYYASISVAVEDTPQPVFYNSWDIAALDLNVDHITWSQGVEDTYTPRMARLQDQIKHYQRQLARKRRTNPHHFRTKNYARCQAKLNRAHQRIGYLQQELVNTFTHRVTRDYAVICLEDLDVNGMKMSRHKAKNVQRSLFRRLRTTIEYKAAWHHRHVVLADRFFPSTQRCSHCGYIKTKASYGGKMMLHGDSIYHDHSTYRCYQCGAVFDRDENAVENLRQYAAGLTAGAGDRSLMV